MAFLSFEILLSRKRRQRGYFRHQLPYFAFQLSFKSNLDQYLFRSLNLQNQQLQIKRATNFFRFDTKCDQIYASFFVNDFACLFNLRQNQKMKSRCKYLGQTLRLYKTPQLPLQAWQWTSEGKKTGKAQNNTEIYHQQQGQENWEHHGCQPSGQSTGSAGIASSPLSSMYLKVPEVSKKVS